MNNKEAVKILSKMLGKYILNEKDEAIELAIESLENDKIYIVLVGKDDKDIESVHRTIRGANSVVIDLCDRHYEQILYDKRGCAYSESGDFWICEVDLQQ